MQGVPGWQSRSRGELIGLLEADGEALAEEWIGLVAASLSGRISRAEVAHELRELYSALLEAIRSGAEDAVAGQFGKQRAYFRHALGARCWRPSPRPCATHGPAAVPNTSHVS
ncbi:RsbRD N-terminal domain-containing protein [Streptomyces sp. NPDC005279]|uniref:RsbRD N-terminal domain-containing protein n=1 Tax=Streptomyces sp. NPDC005279 TaxID=3364712 RepID=UPI0036836FFE